MKSQNVFDTFKFEIGLKSFRVASFLLAMLVVSGCNYLSSQAFKNALQTKNCEEAKSILLNTLRSDVNNEKADYNLVHAFVCSGDLAASIKQINALLKNKSPYAFELLFIKGYVLGEMGEIERALSAYQKALDIHSDLRIKENMELLLKESKSGKSGKKKKGKGNKDQSETDKNEKGEQDDPEQKNNDSKESDPNDKDPKNNKSKKMSQKQIEKIMKEIDGDEKKIRSQGLKIKSKKGGGSNEKNW